MANHGFVNFPNGTPDPNDITNVVRNFLYEKFGDQFEISYNESNKRWFVEFGEGEYGKDRDHLLNQSFFLNEEGQLEIRHGHYGREYANWIDYCIRAIVAKEFDGFITDEGISERIPVEEKRMKSFEEYIEPSVYRKWAFIKEELSIYSDNLVNFNYKQK